ncbi:hypothetical protein [Cellulophaga tyrosinoxydans]|uniref:Fibronectin type-III domain-containing protein n=1 Tax=Cellulophaga tyrosinoxydans TaxID=504486 RepID=A0A1W1ZET0_9FLAO|nr:hypothetical protein [Cellulophaga tyrosinoxydans]SMC46903.1 hypothetical protein SAMN05660703_1429 [Cellulophaga tyrosinoxydans]
MKSLNYTILLALIFLTSCGGGSDGGSTTEPDPIPNPTAATLIFPENNKECTEGSVLNELQSSVNFQWSASENTDSYSLTVTNLNTNSSSTTTSSTTEKTITLQRGTPYEWFVTSKANGTAETAISSKFRFYNQGVGVENYAPFPAVAVSPKRGITLSTRTNVDLQWIGEDIDNDIASYEILFGTEIIPTNSLGSTTTNTMNTSVISGNVYYWVVITNDQEGNKSRSEVFEFKVD